MEIPATAAQIPTSFYVVIGVLVVGNIGVIVSAITFIFKAGMLVATIKSGIKEAKDAAIRAHKRIDVIEKGE